MITAVFRALSTGKPPWSWRTRCPASTAGDSWPRGPQPSRTTTSPPETA